MKMTTLLLATGMTLVLAASGCKSKNDVSATTPPPAEGDAGTKSAQFGGAAAADSLFFSLERTVCFGQCPSYRIQVYRSGHVVYEGRNFVEPEGLHRGTVSADTMALLLNKAETLGFFDLDDKYDGQVTDLPSTIIRVVANGKDKKVIGRVGTPASFKSLATAADELLLSLRWVPMPPQE
jgi:hypothetical protein